MPVLFDTSVVEAIKKLKHWAHTPACKGDPDETFQEHVDRTRKYREDIFTTFALVPIIKRLLTEMKIDNVDLVYDIICDMIDYHDLGKLTPAFQRKKLETNAETHSDKSFFTIVYMLAVLKTSNKITTSSFYFCTILAYSVLKHHGSLNNLLEELHKLSEKHHNSDNPSAVELTHALHDILSAVQYMPIDEKLSGQVTGQSSAVLWQVRQKPLINLIQKFLTNDMACFILVRLIYSVLVATDYYATHDYKSGKSFSHACLSDDLRKKVDLTFFKAEFLDSNLEKLNYNYKIEQRRSELLQKAKDIACITELNELRNVLNVKAEDDLIAVLKRDSQAGVFYLNVPTGGGKTNLSLRLALTVMRHRTDIQKLMYVFPFINLIEQSQKTLVDFVGDENLVRLDSKYIPPTRNEEADDYDLSLDLQFHNYPVQLMSHVRFFDQLLRNHKRAHYPFYQLANSIVIIDEIQAYKDEVWTEIAHLLHAVSKHLNTVFIVMSATLPKIQDLLIQKTNFIQIFEPAFVDGLFKHPCFQRNQIIPNGKFGINPAADGKQGQVDNGILNNALSKELLQFIQAKKRVLFVVNKVKDSRSVIQWLAALKENKAPKELRDVLFDLPEKPNDKPDGTYRILLLNSTICNYRRKQIIQYCKNTNNKMLLISTQSVEAGVDLDFEIGFRAYAPMDSIVQVAGRINRECQQSSSENILYVYKDAGFESIYSQGIKAEITQEMETAFWKKESFDPISEIEALYSAAITRLKAKNENKFIESSTGNIADMQNLFFREVDHNVHLIDGDTVSLFIPFDVPRAEFDDAWFEILKIDPKSETVSGEEIYNAYINAIESGDYSPAKLKNLRKVLNPFVINVFDSWVKGGHRLSQVLAVNPERNSQNGINDCFYFCKKWSTYYSIETGLDVEAFKRHVGVRQSESLFL